MLTTFRSQIDEIDQELVELLAKRFKIVQQVGEHKKEHQLPPLQPGRWQEVLAKRTTQAEEVGIDPTFITDVWNCIHEYALRIEAK